MEGGVVLPAGLFFSGLLRGAAALRPGQVAACFASGRLACRPPLCLPKPPEISSGPEHHRTLRKQAGPPGRGIFDAS